MWKRLVRLRLPLLRGLRDVGCAAAAPAATTSAGAVFPCGHEPGLQWLLYGACSIDFKLHCPVPAVSPLLRGAAAIPSHGGHQRAKLPRYLLCGSLHRSFQPSAAAHAAALAAAALATTAGTIATTAVAAAVGGVAAAAFCVARQPEPAAVAAAASAAAALATAALAFAATSVAGGFPASQHRVERRQRLLDWLPR